MGLLGRIFGRTDKASWASSTDDSLVRAPIGRSGPTARASDLPALTPWSAARLQAIFQELALNPGPQVLLEARRARQCLVRLWLAAPVDQLEILYRSAVGNCQRALLSGVLTQQPLLPEEEAWKNGLSQRLLQQFERPETTNVLLAAMTYFPRGKMRVADPLRQIPQWLLRDYAALHDPALLQRLQQPLGLLGPVGSTGLGVPGPAQVPQPQVPQTQPMPVLAARRGQEALNLVNDREYLGRMNGLINLYAIDPNDAEVRRELIGLRRQLGQIWLDVNPAQIQQLYQSPLGQVYRNLLASAFPREALIPDDQQLRGQLARVVSNMNQPQALNALLAVLPFYPPGKIQFGGGEQLIPAWLRQEISSLYGPAAGSAPPPPPAAAAPFPATS